MKTIAIDFDGTLFEDKFPDIGCPRHETIVAALAEQQKGNKLILWTCREDEKLEEAMLACQRYGLVFDAVNNQLPEHIANYGNNPRKVFADEYWDDRMVKYPGGANG